MVWSAFSYSCLLFRMCNACAIPLNKINSNDIYKLKCKTCNNSYVGQTASSIGIRHCEHTRYIKTNNPISAQGNNNLPNVCSLDTGHARSEQTHREPKKTKSDRNPFTYTSSENYVMFLFCSAGYLSSLPRHPNNYSGEIFPLVHTLFSTLPWRWG